MSEDLKQEAIRTSFEAQGDGPWTTVYDSESTPSRSVLMYCAMADAGRRDEALGDGGWLLITTSGAPGFIQSWNSGEMVATYLPRGSIDEDIEPLVLVREYHGAAATELEIDQQFRLFHNLRYDATSKTFTKMHDDGSQTSAIRFPGDMIDIRTSLLKQYMAARGMDLLLFIDSRVYSEAPPDSDDMQQFRSERLGADLSFFESRGSSSGRHGSILHGTKILAHGPVDSCGMWPFDDDNDDYPEFIIDEDEYGKPVRFCCNPDLLANNFGKNPDAPHYLTPVHFRREVLQKYYDNPELYTVSDGRLRCAGLWGVQIDNDHNDRVVVFLGDIGRDLPSKERDHWRAHMIAPDAEISETNLRRSFLSLATNPKAADLAFRRAYRNATDAWASKYGWPLFREPVESDVYLLQQVRLPLNDGQNEFEDAIKTLAKLLSDALNESEIVRRLGSKVPNEKGISKLERLLATEGYPHVERDISFLRKVQELRSKTSAHLKGSDYQAMLTRNLGTDRGIEAVQVLLAEGLSFLNDVTNWASQ